MKNFAISCLKDDELNIIWGNYLKEVFSESSYISSAATSNRRLDYYVENDIRYPVKLLNETGKTWYFSTYDGCRITYSASWS